MEVTRREPEERAVGLTGLLGTEAGLEVIKLGQGSILGSCTGALQRYVAAAIQAGALPRRVVRQQECFADSKVLVEDHTRKPIEVSTLRRGKVKASLLAPIKRQRA
ncbi:MAG: hypothetical protein DI596_09500 [Azospira oryzae]|nr:MAG: hypothetical protein DI596_09500 [Azospira oryzae]PZP78915.1 MAG: hypothetical protein DI593_09500 [Azospira oryzae]